MINLLLDEMINLQNDMSPFKKDKNLTMLSCVKATDCWNSSCWLSSGCLKFRNKYNIKFYKSSYGRNLQHSY